MPNTFDLKDHSIEARDEGQERGTPSYNFSGHVWSSDGLVIEGKAGLGVNDSKPWTRFCGSMGKLCKIFQAQTLAIF